MTASMRWHEASDISSGTPGAPRGPSPARNRPLLVLGLSLALGLAATTARAADCRAPAEPGIDWSACDRSNLMLSGARLDGARLADTDFSLTDLREADLSGADLEKATLVRASLAGARADDASFRKVEGYRANFSDLSAKDASFEGGEFQRANFRGADLAGSRFDKAELGRVYFEGADLTGAGFRYANLARAHFAGVTLAGQPDFTGAYLYLTRLEGVDLSTATGLAQAQVALACGDDATILPEGLSRPTDWPCPKE
ncbi:pentapeptide repeat-containing protein [Aurantimonas sp. A2-1-M11]|uniref:pentapeptide repeat-containing protein n=1 Tax=Aurantimonas sp. A2-1-M11 TaxID=3113712 RepID=UPI002F928CBA